MTTTVFISVLTITNKHTLVGNKGGHSHVVAILHERHPMLGVVVETEHGIMCFGTNEFVEVLL